MTTFTIDSDNNITAHAEKPTTTEGMEAFATEKAFHAMAAKWPANRLIDIWNTLPGVVPVKRFTDRKCAASRIWKQIQSLSPAPAQQAAHKPPKKAKGTKAQPAADAAATARDGSKKAEVIALMRRADGATLTEVMTATGWQKHTVRGFVAGALKKMGLTVESTRRDDQERVYHICA
jgi:hypothetical protein